MGASVFFLSVAPVCFSLSDPVPASGYRGAGALSTRRRAASSSSLPSPLPLSSKDFNNCISACGPAWGFIRMNCLSQLLRPRNDKLHSAPIYYTLTVCGTQLRALQGEPESDPQDFLSPHGDPTVPAFFGFAESWPICLDEKGLQFLYPFVPLCFPTGGSLCLEGLLPPLLTWTELSFWVTCCL